MAKETKPAPKGPVVINNQPVEEKFITREERIKHRDCLLRIGDGQVGRDLFHMLTARYKILYIRSPEEDRVLEALKHISLYDGIELYRWDCSRGLLDAHQETQITSVDSEVHENPIATLSYIIDVSKSDHEKMMEKKVGPRGRIFVMLDMHGYLESNMWVLERKFKEFARISSVSSIVIVSPVFSCPPSLNKEFTLVDFPLPSREEIKESLDKIIREIPDDYPEAIKAAKQNEEQIINSARGLTLVEAENAYARSLVKNKGFVISSILDEKKQIIRKSGILEYHDPTVTFDEIGGLDTLKEWLFMRRLSFSEEARKFGLPTPKGVLLIGIPGTGKSLTCSALASVYEMPLLRLDMGAIFGSHIGESEANIRNAIQTVEAIAPAILWIDEIEKGISGVGSSNMTDGGVSARVFGTFLTWMQEKTEPVFVVCTANNIRGIPPEFLRAGRFDEIFFLDLPNEEQRREVIGKLISKKRRDPLKFDIDSLVNITRNYSPAEIEKGVDNALFVAFSEGRREMETQDIASELGKFQPLYNGRREDIEDMRRQALGENGTGGMARLANSTKNATSVVTTANAGRKFDLKSEDI
jgi:SpoVK/Ycf46/Vps4 family AAA+-type ATPase